MSKLVLVETVSMFRIRYVVETPDDHPEFALDDVTLGEIQDEFSQKHLGETIISHRVISEEEYLATFDEDNDYLKSWTPEQKLRYVHKSED